MDWRWYGQRNPAARLPWGLWVWSEVRGARSWS
jgi:hypothetical protein